MNKKRKFFKTLLFLQAFAIIAIMISWVSLTVSKVNIYSIGVMFLGCCMLIATMMFLLAYYKDYEFWINLDKMKETQTEADKQWLKSHRCLEAIKRVAIEKSGFTKVDVKIENLEHKNWKP